MAEATYDLKTPIGKVRLEIPDTNVDSPLFTDDEIQHLLEVNHENVSLAAAHALSIILGDPNRSIQWTRGNVSAAKNLAGAIQQRINQLRANAEAFSSVPMERPDWP